MYEIREKMKEFPVGTNVIVYCSDDPDKKNIGELLVDKGGHRVIVFEDGNYYYPDDSDSVTFVDKYYKQYLK